MVFPCRWRFVCHVISLMSAGKPCCLLLTGSPLEGFWNTVIVPSSLVPRHSQTSQASATSPPFTRSCAVTPSTNGRSSNQTARRAVALPFIGIRRPSAPAALSPLCLLPYLLRLRPVLGGLIVLMQHSGGVVAWPPRRGGSRENTHGVLAGQSACGGGGGHASSKIALAA